MSEDEDPLAQLLSVSVHSPSPARNSDSWWSVHGPKWMPEMESGLQPVYNIGHVVGPNRRTGPFFQNIWLCILILFFAPFQYLQCMFPCLIRA